MKGTLWHEKDGDFNPGWALVIWYALVLGSLMNGAAILVATLNPKAWPVLPAVLTFDAVVIIVACIGVFSIARSKLLANSTVLAAGVKGISAAVAPPFPGMDYAEGDDAERV